MRCPPATHLPTLSVAVLALVFAADLLIHIGRGLDVLQRTRGLPFAARLVGGAIAFAGLAAVMLLALLFRRDWFPVAAAVYLFAKGLASVTIVFVLLAKAATIGGFFRSMPRAGWDPLTFVLVFLLGLEPWKLRWELGRSGFVFFKEEQFRSVREEPWRKLDDRR